jgi:glucose/arabinose dehydrogenase
MGASLASAQEVTGPVEQTAKVPAATGWKAETVIEGLRNPWSIAWLPDGTMLITERPGALRVASKDGKLRDEPVKGMPNVFASGQGGLMDVSLHPQFADNHVVYLTFSAGTQDANYTTLVRARLNDDATELTEVKEIFRNPVAKPGGQHFGSRIAWRDDGTMLLSVGDGGNPPVSVDGKLVRENAQDTSKLFGKVLRLDEFGEPPAANPFLNDAKADPRVFSYGHRNIQGMAIDLSTGNVWATEHGSRGGDELNKIEPAVNYGWPLATYSVEYRGGRISDAATIEGARDPAVVWTPCIAPSGLTFYTGDAFPGWKGDLFAGGLVLKQIRRIDFENGVPVGQQNLQFDQRVRDVRQGPDGGLYVLTDERNGKLLRIVPE